MLNTPRSVPITAPHLHGTVQLAVADGLRLERNRVLALLRQILEEHELPPAHRRSLLHDRIRRNRAQLTVIDKSAPRVNPPLASLLRGTQCMRGAKRGAEA